ncbi:hypothetical protein KPSA3_02041 [Pseudomonas syringae pv. actinidiae]|uniref:Uncharacterized protein n=1 Tax=Pseudomonas syringae pv. actinidiae TaxID=103796 RepID=A0AAN4Q287_PSESF|nr:hypothetical protein KPSA3_02041 [Pseudomonas syringae pv. actinidiae]
MSPTSYQTAPSRVCVSAFYREMAGCQWLVFKKCFFFNRLARRINRLVQHWCRYDGIFGP